MRKLLLSLLAVGAMAVPANALYLIGNPAGGFSPSKGIEMDEIDGLGHETWTWTGEMQENDYFAFATKLLDAPTEENNTWNEFNANYRLSPAADGTEAVNGVFPLHFGAPDVAFKNVGTYSKYCVTRDAEGEYNLNVTLIAAYPYTSPYNEWSLIGEFNDWNGDVEMTRVNDNVWTVTVDKLAGQFKFRANKDWKLNIGSGDDATVLPEKSLQFAVDGGNFEIAETENVTLTLDLEAGTLTFGEPTIVEKETMYLIGEPAGRWDPSVGIEMNKTAEGWVWEGAIGQNQGYAFATQLGKENVEGGENTWDDFNKNYRLSPAENNLEAVDGDFPLYSGNSSNAFKGMNTYSKYTITKNEEGEYNLNILLIAAQPVSSPLNKWSLIGAFNGWNGDVEMTQVSDSVWTVTVDKLDGDFKFRANKNWKLNLGAVSEDKAAVSFGNLYAAATDGPNFNIAEAENVTLRINTDNMTLSVTEGDSSIGYVPVDDSEAVYFNLQGIRVAKPDKGIYIRVANGKSEKVVL